MPGLQSMAAVKLHHLHATAMAALLLLPLSTLFFLLSYCYSNSCYLEYLPSSFSLTSTISLHDVDYLMNKKLMFLFCNVILLIVTRGSALLRIFNQKGAAPRRGTADSSGSCAKFPPLLQRPEMLELIESTQPCSVAEEQGAAAAAAADEPIGPLDLVAVASLEIDSGSCGEEEEVLIDELHRKIEEFIEREKSQRRLEDLQ